MRRKTDIKEEASGEGNEKDGGGLNHNLLHVTKAQEESGKRRRLRRKGIEVGRRMRTASSSSSLSSPSPSSSPPFSKSSSILPSPAPG